mmetsp:Transcript_36612/g.118273  ORF Transcript_36612/g.118273 Transcript_36612/m.118273 type:complete len:222 (-) Transcript_36612:2984-3649(-)
MRSSASRSRRSAAAWAPRRRRTSLWSCGFFWAAGAQSADHRFVQRGDVELGLSSSFDSRSDARALAGALGGRSSAPSSISPGFVRGRRATSAAGGSLEDDAVDEGAGPSPAEAAPAADFGPSAAQKEGCAEVKPRQSAASIFPNSCICHGSLASSSSISGVGMRMARRHCGGAFQMPCTAIARADSKVLASIMTSAGFWLFGKSTCGTAMKYALRAATEPA